MIVLSTLGQTENQEIEEGKYQASDDSRQFQEMEGKDESREEQGNARLDVWILIVLFTLGQTQDQEIEGGKDQASEQWDDSRQLQEMEVSDENREEQGNVRLDV